MSLIRPFRGLRPAPGRADAVVAPPYDVLNTEEARERAIGRSNSFLHISKPEIDLPAGTNPHAPEVYDKGRDNFVRMIEEGVLVRDESPCYYIYRLIMGEHVQTGLVAVSSVADYDTNRIRKHEFTRPDKEDDRVRQIDALNTQTGPVFLTYRHSVLIDDITTSIVAGSPAMDVVADDGVQHTVWVVDDTAMLESITREFDAMECIYIADGHHRSAAASRVAMQRKAANSNHTGREDYNYFLSVIFPDNQMQILDYNRVVTDLNKQTAEEFLAAVTVSFTVTESSEPVKPQTSAEYGMYLQGQWYRLGINPDLIPADDPVGCLDISLLANNLIEPILGISDPRRDKRIDFVGGIRGLAELEKRVDSGEMAVAFSLYPTSLTQLMNVADAGEVMPPKSTWFEPKLADGLVSHMLD
ncbi:MAG: DUF1015 domain-containing protein [Acidiferrobacterales bacterium]